VKSITDEPANYQKMIRLTKEKSEKLVEEVEPTFPKLLSVEQRENKK
jgi:hypothetical protein